MNSTPEQAGFASVKSAQVSSLKPHTVDIEVDIMRGLHSFNVVGLAGKAVEESRDRVSAAIKNSGFKSPKKKNQKVVISLAPADIKKKGPIFDVAIALAYLKAAEEINFNPKQTLFLGELSLSGEIRPINGLLPLLLHARGQGFQKVFVPKNNSKEAALVSGIDIFAASNLSEVIAHLTDKKPVDMVSEISLNNHHPTFEFDFKDIKGNGVAKRGLEIAAAGGHNIALFGPPGTGKTLLARAFPSILPPLSYEEVLEVTGIHSTVGAHGGDLVTAPPFRAPHHTASYVSMVGGGQTPRPGEVTLAHRGVLFLDEFPEFNRRVLESLRQPLEDSMIQISRARGSAKFPANFILVAAMNPCPCGKFGSGKCNCTPVQLQRYRKKLSGPIIDRIDMWIEVAKVDYEKLAAKNSERTSTESRKQVEKARRRQSERFSSRAGIATNSDMGSKHIDSHITLSEDVQNILSSSARSLELSARAYHRTIKLARTIADLDACNAIEESHLLEALQYRPHTQK